MTKKRVGTMMRNSTGHKSSDQRTMAGRSLVFKVVSALFVILALSLIFLSGRNTDSSLIATKQIAPFFDQAVRHWNDDIQRWALEYDLDPNLIATVMQIESCGDPTVVSSAGAIGLFQVMPFHFEVGEDPYDPETNAYRGMSYLRTSFEESGDDPNIAMAGYNGGLGVISLPSIQWYEETQRYHYWGSRIYADAKTNAESSQAFDEWMDSFGATMCANARARLSLYP